VVYPHLREAFDAAGGDPSRPAEDLAPCVRALPAYGWFAWLERGSQKMLWRAVEAAVGVEAAKGPVPEGPSRLELAPDLELPDWYTDWDIHLQPGGVWSSNAAARVYELGAKLVMMGANDDYRFHHLFTETALPDAPYRRILDLGCGFGKSTWPLKQRFRAADVIGVDLAAPCLQLAVERSNARGLEILYRQADAADTGLPSQSFDLVVSTMLIHELPPEVLPRLFHEAARLLRPGGRLAFLDFHKTGDGFRDFAMAEHSVRNNEPFMAPMMEADLLTLAKEAGFKSVAWTAFDERAEGDLGDRPRPRRPEWHFPWAVLHGERR
jgi:ubiquinone/menaquinone biosynthesis C-methylase UbiE